MQSGSAAIEICCLWTSSFPFQLYFRSRSVQKINSRFFTRKATCGYWFISQINNNLPLYDHRAVNEKKICKCKTVLLVTFFSSTVVADKKNQLYSSSPILSLLKYRRGETNPNFSHWSPSWVSQNDGAIIWPLASSFLITARYTEEN